MAVRDPNNPIYWVGHDRLLLNDVTHYGLHRKVIARRDGMPDVAAWLQAIQIECPGAKPDQWIYEKDGFIYVWLVWKDKRNEKVS